MEIMESNPNDRPPSWPRGPIPAGSYAACIVSSYLDHFSDHLILALTWMLTEGEYRSRRVFDWLSLSGDEETVAGGYGKFLAIARAIGHPAPESVTCSEELEDRPCLIQVEVVELEDEPTNEVRSYRPLAGRAEAFVPLPAVA